MRVSYNKTNIKLVKTVFIQILNFELFNNFATQTRKCAAQN